MVVSPALQSYTHNAPAVLRRNLLVANDTSALTNVAYAPDAADHLVVGDSLNSQFVSFPMSAGITFTNGETIKWALQCLEVHANNNLALRLWIGIYSLDGTTLQRELLPKTDTPPEMATTLTNRFNSTTQSGATYTTAYGDRLVIETSAQGTPGPAAGGTQGHNASVRYGCAGTGDLPEDDTSTSTTLNPWIEFVPNITFAGAIPPVGARKHILMR